MTLATWAALAVPVSDKDYSNVAEVCRAVEAITERRYHCWSKEREKEGLAYWACRLSSAIKGDHGGRHCWVKLKK